MRIISQEGDCIFNFENVLSIRRSGRFIKVMLQMPMYDPNDEHRLPQIVIARYDTEDKAEFEFDRFIAKLELSGNGVWQFPKENE